MARIEYLLVLRLHEVVADHVESDHVPVFNTAHVGIGHLNIELGQRAQFATITTRHGLPNNVIDHLEEDGLGNFWCNSQNGIFRVSRQELNDCADGKASDLRALVFGKAEGLATLAGSGGFTPSGFRAPDGRLWFPTARGLAVVNPASVRPNRVPPPVLIEEILVDGQRMDIQPQALTRNPARSTRAAQRSTRRKLAELSRRRLHGETRIRQREKDVRAFASDTGSSRWPNRCEACKHFRSVGITLL